FTGACERDAAIGKCAGALDPSHQYQDEQDNDNDAEPAGRVVAPPCAIGPRRQRTEKEQNENDEDDGPRGHTCLLTFDRGSFTQTEGREPASRMTGSRVAG